MSFILDALKKSELERQRQSMPGMMQMPAPPRRRGIPVWVWVLAGLLSAVMFGWVGDVGEDVVVKNV